MRRFLITLGATIFCFCLVFVFPSRTSAQVTHGTASCPEGKIVKTGNGVSCVLPLPVSTPGHGGGSNPNDWGMCGVLRISGAFGPPTEARIIVQPDGHYAVQLAAFQASVLPTLEWTCVLFKDFRGVPPVSDASFSGPPYPSYNGGSAGNGINITGSAKNACIWAGLFGNLESYNDANQGGFGYAYAQYDGPETKIGSQSVTSYAFCSGYSTPAWTGWKYYHHGYSFYAPPSHDISIGLTDAHYWCYADGIETRLLYPNYELGPISAGVNISSGGDYSISATPSPASASAGGVLVDFNCLPLEQ
jgi:hypothetical protein